MSYHITMRFIDRETATQAMHTVRDQVLYAYEIGADYHRDAHGALTGECVSWATTWDIRSLEQTKRIFRQFGGQQ